MEIIFRVSFYWNLLHFVNSLLLAYLDARSRLRILRPTNSLSCEVTSFQSSEPTWKYFPSLAGTRCSISVPPVTKRSSTKRSIILATVFPVAGLLAMGSSIFSHAASASHRTRGLIVMLLVSFHCLEYQLAWEPCHNYTVLCQGCSTSVEGHRSYAGFFNLAAIFGG